MGSPHDGKRGREDAAGHLVGMGVEATGVIFGLLFGIPIGMLLGNIAMGIGIGVAGGLAVGVARRRG